MGANRAWLCPGTGNTRRVAPPRVGGPFMRQRPCRIAGRHAWLATTAGLTLVLLTLGIQTAHADQPGGSSSSASTPGSAPTAGLASSSGGLATDPPPTSGCPSVITITAIAIQKDLDNGQVVVDVSHDGQGCPDATPAILHVHQNLSTSPQAGSDLSHQSNVDIAVGANFGSSISFDLLTAVPGKCFVQFDVSAGSIRRGRFFPTATCPAGSSLTTPSGSPSAAGSSSSPPPTSSTPPPTLPRTSHSVANVSTSRSVANVTTSRLPHHHPRPLAMTGAHTGELTGVAALLLGLGAMLWYAARPSRRH